MQSSEDITRPLNEVGAQGRAANDAAFQYAASWALRANRGPSREEVLVHAARTDPDDLPLFACALREPCPVLAAFDLRACRPGHPA